MSRRIHVVMPDSLVAQISGALGLGQSRGDWIRRAVEQALSEAKEPAMTEQASPGSVPSVKSVRLAATAERPVRSSTQAKTGVGPRPKGGK